MHQQNGSHKIRSQFSISEEETEAELTSCGLGSWRPEWLQYFANPIAFLVSISMVAVFQSMAGSLVYSTMSTLEKRYAFDSGISSLLYIADNINWLITSPIAGYYAVRFNRSALIGMGQIILSLSCFLSALPYFIYGPFHATHSESSSSIFNSNSSSSLSMIEMCSTNDDHQDSCSTKQNSLNTVWPAVIILFVANFLRGTGTLVYMVIALPFVDDNVSKRNSPTYISVMHTILLIGPLLGFLLGAFCLNFYEDPWNDPGLSRNDPRFVGAWWLAFIIVGFLNLFTSLPMFLYPAQFKNASVKAVTIKKKMKESGGTKEALMRLVRNPLVVLFTVGNTFRYFGTIGFFTIFTKYLETQYRQSSSQASFITGSASITPVSVGILIGGLFITWFRPSTRLLFILIFLAEFFTFFTCGAGLFIGCDPIRLNGEKLEAKFSLESSCNLNCDCSTQMYTPICGPDSSTTYFSPCHAGCTSYNSSSLTFENCSCFSGAATKGYCPTDQYCPNLIKFATLLAIGSFVQSTAKTGNSLITFRTVDPMDKSFANGVLASLVSIVSLIPAPIFYGYLADSSCLVWEEKCGKRGNCWVYDTDIFRYKFLGVSILFMFLGSVFDFIMIFYADRIKNWYDDEDDEKEDEIENEKTKVIETQNQINVESRPFMINK